MYYEDEIYHSAYSDGYSDGYYAGMELYHADDEMTEEERRARRRRRRRNIALGVAGAAGVAGAGVAGYAIGRALRKRGRGIVPAGPRLTGPSGSSGSRGPSGPSGSRGPSGPSGSRGPKGPKRIGGPILERVYGHAEEPIGWDFKRNKPKYMDDEINETLYRAHAANKYFTEYDHDKKKWVRRDSTSYRH